MHCLLGIDLGSSSVKAAILDVESGRCLGNAFRPEREMKIDVPEPGFAEQHPETWHAAAREAVGAAMAQANLPPDAIRAIGISYQMHGLVCVDRNQRLLRPAIIWCDGRAVPYGRAAFEALGPERCRGRLLNSPGNFTAAKLAWVKENEPDVYARIDKILLPGDWLAMRLTGRARTTVSGLSEGIFWDFEAEAPADFLLDHFGFDPSLLPEIVSTFEPQGELTAEAAKDFGLAPGTPVTYRAGDQPNNALSLNVSNPGEVAATAGTSGVVYGITDQKRPDPQSRLNLFAHVNHAPESPRLGMLLCINGTGILNAWTRRMMGDLSYDDMTRLARTAPIGSDGLVVLPFGNGAERMLGNRAPGARFVGLDLNRHDRAHLCRAVQEGIVFAFLYGLEAMAQAGLDARTIRAGRANLFLSDVFRETLAGGSGASIELFETDGAIGAARAAGFGAALYPSLDVLFSSVRKIETTEPRNAEAIRDAYERWKGHLDRTLS